MSWKLWAAASAAALLVGPSARANDLFHMAPPAQADTLTVGFHGHFRGDNFRQCPFDPRYNPSFGFGFPPPAFFYAPPTFFFPAPPVYTYTTPGGLGVTTYSLPAGNVTYSVTRPPAPGAEQLPPPLPRDETFPYDGGPANPVPRPRAEPGPTSPPRYFHLAPLDDIRVSLPDKATGAKGKFSYPAYGEQPRRTAPGR
jgi:hypothetical protein